MRFIKSIKKDFNVKKEKGFKLKAEQEKKKKKVCHSPKRNSKAQSWTKKFS